MAAKKSTHKYFIDCQITVEDNVITVENFAEYLRNHIKVDGKKQNLKDRVTVEADGYNVVVTVKGDFSKRYLKYLSKKYLKKQDMRDYLRVVASNKNSYQLKYFKYTGGDEDEDEEDAE